MILNNSSIVKMTFYLTQTFVDMIQSFDYQKRISLQVFPSNVDIDCRISKYQYRTNYWWQPRLIFWVMHKDPASLLLMSIFIVSTLVILSYLVIIILIFVKSITTLPIFILLAKTILLMAMAMIILLSPNCQKVENLYTLYICKVLSIHNLSSIQQLKNITIDIKNYCQVQNLSIYWMKRRTSQTKLPNNGLYNQKTIYRT